MELDRDKVGLKGSEHLLNLFMGSHGLARRLLGLKLVLEKLVLVDVLGPDSPRTVVGQAACAGPLQCCLGSLDTASG